MKIFKYIKSSPVGLTGLIIIIFFFFIAIFSDYITPHGPNEYNLRMRYLPPFWAGGKIEYFLGTDQLGRDMLSRLIYGSRISLIVGIGGVIVSMILGVFLGLFGAGFLILNSSEIDGGSSFLGDVLVFINALSYAIYLIMIKSMMKKYHLVTVLKTIFLIGFIIILPFGWTELPSIVEFADMTLEIWLKILFVVLFTTCGAYLLNIFAVSHLRSSTVAFYIYLQPLLTTLFLILLGHDPWTITMFVSASCIFIGVYLYNNKNLIESVNFNWLYLFPVLFLSICRYLISAIIDIKLFENVGVKIRNNTTDIASFGSDVTLTGGTLQIKNSATKFAQVDSTGLKVFGGDASNADAFFGAGSAFIGLVPEF